MKEISMLLVAIILWGVAIAPTKWALESIQPFTLLFLRLCFAGGICLLFSFQQLRKNIINGDVPWKRISVLSFTGVAGYFMFTSYGISLTSGLHVSIIDAALPLVTIIFSALFLKEKIQLNYWIGIILGFIGVICITIPSGSNNQSASLVGDMLILLSTFLFAFYTILLKRPKQEKNLSNEVFTTLTLIIGAIILFPFAVIETFYNGLPQIDTWKAGLSFTYLVVCATILSYWFWNKALERVAASVSGLYLNALPLISIIASISLLNESLTWKTLIGGVLVLCGVIWADQEKLRVLIKSVDRKTKEDRKYKTY
ncbi:EamA/RhaT family transporter [Bacillus cereus]|uniref:DMT family transporter n=1 Tax=unclassified Bacillus (in: firmicutes) TaxID=185979 RepID=UPI00047BE967|nr:MULTISPECIES: DMT family transporter [unclassified Bacillus (in: firmicutes)]PFE05232.1 EamA/RhaT family transporter [Bacillus sp. AFS023182]PGX89691.1 EamA/RhaT family transporter [Bacillus cereus]